LFPEVTASYLPGWVFNAATILHGEEAFLAAVFLFTVHYFNSHFRPTKLPQDITMFTGTVPLHETLPALDPSQATLKTKDVSELHLQWPAGSFLQA
jgi:hypothetical protein